MHSLLGVVFVSATIFVGLVGYDLYYSNSPDHSPVGFFRALGVTFGLVFLALFLQLVADKTQKTTGSLPSEDAASTTGHQTSAYEFPTDKRTIRFARYAPLLYLWMPIGAHALFSQVESGFFTGKEGTGILVFKIVIVVTASIGPILLAWMLVRRVPRNAEEGVLRVRPDGVDYHIGKHRADVSWSQVGSVHPVVPSAHLHASGIWFAKREIKKLNPSQEHLLSTSMAHRIVAPKQLAGGMLLPLSLFSQEASQAIVEKANASLESSTRKRSAQSNEITIPTTKGQRSSLSRQRPL